MIRFARQRHGGVDRFETQSTLSAAVHLKTVALLTPEELDQATRRPWTTALRGRSRTPREGQRHVSGRRDAGSGTLPLVVRLSLGDLRHVPGSQAPVSVWHGSILPTLEPPPNGGSSNRVG